MIATDINSMNVHKAKIKLSRRAIPPSLRESYHKPLLDYLLSRLQSQASDRNARLARYARIDKIVSTWQQLSKADSDRKARQEATGVGQAIHINLPVTHTHLDDMVSFFAGVYAPAAGSFYQMPEPESQDKGNVLVDKLNADAKQNKYFKELCSALRGLLKYNIGGFIVEWTALTESSSGSSKGSNMSKAIDVYNFMYDPSIDDPADIPSKAEFAAISMRENRMTLIKREQAGEYHGLYHILESEERGNGNVATHYNFPPNHAGLTAEDAPSKKGRADWASYGVGLIGDTATPLEYSHEVVEMYCWLNPDQFKIIPVEGTPEKDTYQLFKFTIVDAKRIVSIEYVGVDDEAPTPDHPPRIPYFVGYLNQDDMGAAQRSVAELLAPFQNFGSFLLNAHVSGARGAIHGIQAYDPQMFDMDQIEAGSTVGRVKSKIAGRDVRSGLQTINGTTDNGQTMDSLSRLFVLMKEFFPAQALPTQIAGMDRAVTSQVSAVLQGVNRRLHMLVRILDDDILGPARFQQFLNISRGGVEGLDGLTDEVVHRILGSGLSQLNREAAATAMQQLLFAIMQNPQAAQEYDVIGLMNFWSGLMNLNTDLSKFKKAPPADPNAPAPGTQPAPAPAPAA